MMFGLLVAMALLGCVHGVAEEASQQRGIRLAPPPAVSCDRNQLTSWTGFVTAYQRRDGASWIQIHTDWDTDESISIDHRGAADASARYLFRGEPFEPGDWNRIEQSGGGLVEGMRATAWICSDGRTPPVIDWQPVPE